MDWNNEERPTAQAQEVRAAAEDSVSLSLEMLRYGRPSMLQWVWRPHIPEHVAFSLSKCICLSLIGFQEF